MSAFSKRGTRRAEPRTLSSRAFWASSLFAANVTATLMLGATIGPAQAQFKGVYGFGDSYADTGALPGGAFALAYSPNPNFCIYAPNCTFTGSTTFVQSLQSIYGLPAMTNYAIGGARTDNSNTLNGVLPGAATIGGYSYELAQSANVHYSKSDLIALSIGGNDLSGINVQSAVSNPVALNALIATKATGSAVNAVTGVEQMVAQGARNIAWLSTGSSKWFPERTLGKNDLASYDFSNALRDVWADTYYQQTQQLLAPLSASGVRIFLFNFGILQQNVAANPGLYGFTSATNCEAGPAGSATPASVNVNSPGCFYENSVHPTGTAMALIARYMANQINAPTTVSPQGAITTGIADGFAGSVFGRLDVSRNFQPFGAAPLNPNDRWSVFSNVTYSDGARNGQFYASSYDYSSAGGTFGIDYRVDPNWRVGGVFGYSQPEIKLGVQSAVDNIDAYQFAGYASYTDAHLFFDGLVAYGRQNYAIVRDGIIDTIRAETSANSFTAAAHSGYLFEMGSFRLGPIAGLTYTHGTIDAYTEKGDSLLIMTVGKQSIDSLNGSAGVQLRLPVMVGTSLYSPFVNLVAEHTIGGDRTLTTTLVSAPLLPILTPVSSNNDTAFKASAGVAAAMSANVSANILAATSFGGNGSNGVSVSGGLKLAY
jgi:outer membrane lipase/esterase